MASGNDYDIYNDAIRGNKLNINNYCHARLFEAFQDDAIASFEWMKKTISPFSAVPSLYVWIWRLQTSDSDV